MSQFQVCTPTAVTNFGNIIVEQDGATELSEPILKFRSSLGGDVSENDHSGDHNGVNGYWISLLESVSENYYIYNMQTGQNYLVGNRSPTGGDVNVNFIWSDTVDQYYIIDDGRILRKYQIGNPTPVWSFSLPGSIGGERPSGPTGPYSANVNVQWRLSAGSQESQPWITAYDTVRDAFAIVPFNPANGNLLAHFWFEDLSGTAGPTALKAGNVQSAMDGWVFKPTTTAQHLGHWTNGVNGVQIEEGTAGNPANDTSHPAFIGYTEISSWNDVLAGGSGIQQIAVYDHTTPPTLAGRALRCSLDKNLLLAEFENGQTNTNQLAMHHASPFLDGGNEKAWVTIEDQSDGYQILIIANLDDCSFQTIVKGVYNAGLPNFLTSPRPSGNNLVCTYHQANGSNSCVKAFIL